MQITLFFKDSHRDDLTLQDIDEAVPLVANGGTYGHRLVTGMNGPAVEGEPTAVLLYNPDAVAAVLLERDEPDTGDACAESEDGD